MPKILIFLLLTVAGSASARPVFPSELFLAGGALRTCSDLAAGGCEAAPTPAATRKPPTFLVDDFGISRALDSALWHGRSGAPPRAELAVMLASARRDRDWERIALEDKLAAHCAADGCRDNPGRAPWTRLLDDERAALLSALEVPQLINGVRPRERTQLAASREQAGVDVLRAFVAAAAQRANGEAPRIAVVTASAQDSMEAVDFYLAAFEELGAQAQWWPVDAALNTAVFEQGRCDALDRLRRERLRQSGRDRVYPDLGAQQWRACLKPEATATVPAQVHGVFFAGGDQWRHREAFFDAKDQPNAWLLALRERHARGEVVVGGTSAGTAVQGGAAMLSNGTSAQALRGGALARLPMEPGCERAGRCPDGLSEDSLTYWPAGGLGLLPGWTVDTHFSERGRELRLLVLMHAASFDQAMGVDETSALHTLAAKDGLQIEALGASGGWVFQRLPADGSGALAARVHYLAPGARVVVSADGVSGPTTLTATLAKVRGDTAATSRDALDDGALRSAAARLARGDVDQLRLRAGDGTVVLSRTAETRAWRAPTGDVGVLNLQLRFEPAARAR